MRNSRYIFKSVSLGLLAAMVLGTAACAQDAVSGRTQPSMETPEPSSRARSDAFASAAQPSESAAALAESSQPATGAATLAGPQTTTSTATTGGANSFGGSDAELHDNKWHVYGTAYLWVPSMHGSVGVAGYDTNVHVTTGDIFSNFRGGFLGVFTPTYNRFSAPVDVLWMRLRASKPVPSEDYPGYSIRATLNETIITPKVNYLAFDNSKLKVYGTAGARIWHIGTTLNLIPEIDGYNAYKGVTWIDYVMGARFNVPLGTKASVDILGDAGKGGATLDYQVGGIVNLKIKPKMTAQVGWRYLTEHYGNNGSILNTTTQGVVFGGTYQFK